MLGYAHNCCSSLHFAYFKRQNGKNASFLFQFFEIYVPNILNQNFECIRVCLFDGLASFFVKSLHDNIDLK